MATQTTVLDLTKPAGNENALISVINGNMDKVDAEAGKVRGNVAADYSTSSAYAVGALCIHDGNLYSCNTAIGSGGEAWTAAHWTQVTIAGEIAGVAADIPEVVDNLTTTSSTKALSAGQGKTLADQITTVNTNLEKVTKYGNTGFTNKKTFSGTGISTYTLSLSKSSYVNCRCYLAEVYIDGGDLRIGAQAGIGQASGGFLNILPSGSYTVYYNGSGSTSGGSVLVKDAV